MSRLMMGLGVAVVLAILTTTAVILTTGKMDKEVRRDLDQRVRRAQQLIVEAAEHEALVLMRRAKTLADDAKIQDSLDPGLAVEARVTTASEGYAEFLKDPQNEQPVLVGVVDTQGNLLYLLGRLRQPDRPESWNDREGVRKALDGNQLVSKDMWEYRKVIFKVGVAPIFNPDRSEVIGALVIAYEPSSEEAKHQASLLGMEVAYFFGPDSRIRSTSFGVAGADEALAVPLKESGLVEDALENNQSEKTKTLSFQGEKYLAAAVQTDATAGAVVMVSVTRATAPIRTVVRTIILVGVGALLIAVLAILLTARLMLHPVEELEAGVQEITSGNVDYVFPRTGTDYDALSAQLNTMLARLLGRPDPEDQVDLEEGATYSSQVLLDDEPEATPMGGTEEATDPDTLALASEPEADYYRRMYGEYLDQRKDTGEKNEGVTFEGFMAKLRLTEANLKKKYGCKSVRFRVQTKDGQVTLKPVPIF